MVHRCAGQLGGEHAAVSGSGEDRSRPSRCVLVSRSIARSYVHLCCDLTAVWFSVEPEPNHPDPDLRRVTYSELYALVADLVSAFLARGLKPGDRIASYSSNCIVRILEFLPVQIRPAVPSGVVRLASELLPRLPHSMADYWWMFLESTFSDVMFCEFAGERCCLSRLCCYRLVGAMFAHR